MKFGEQLKERLYPEWRFHYIDYDGLKVLLKERSGSNSFAEMDEALFVEALEKEIQKVFDFRDVKGGELTRHVQHCENEVNAIDFDNITEESLLEIESEIGRITFQLSQLANFTRLNYTGFLKILKKHDKYTKFMLKPMFMVRLNTKPLYIENLDSLIYRLSKLYDLLRARGAKQTAPVKIDESSQSFVRKTTKYWVHPDNVTELKCLILKYLPVLIFNNKKIDPAISSVYFDNDEMELYTGRLQKTEGAEAIRIRWYGSAPPNEVFMERKTHKEDWTGESSVKERFIIKEKHVDEYIAGTYTMDKAIAKLKESKAKGEAEIEDLERLSSEIQRSFLMRKLKPKVRTFYRRTAFQLPGDARVRISLDTDLTMIKEDGYTRGRWRRPDVESEHPFSALPLDQVCHFPYAILEVKLQTLATQEPPKWVQDMINGHLVEAVPKFSKFIHGSAVLLEKKVTLFPFWLPQMNVDIRKPVPKMEERAFYPEHHNSPKGESCSTSPSVHTRKENIVIDINEDEESEKTPLIGDSPSRNRTITVGPQRKKGLRMLSCFKIPKNNRIQSSATSAKKKIALPVRVEPKVFFANERTFLSWVNFSIFLGGIASALIGLGKESARVTGFLFSGVSVLFAIYALFLYNWRARKIRGREAGPYDDRVGPAMLVFVFLGAMITSIIFGIQK